MCTSGAILTHNKNISRYMFFKFKHWYTFLKLLRTKMRKEDSPVRHKTTSNSLAKYIWGQRIDQEIYEKLPQYYHKAVDKYLNLQINGSIDSYSIHSRNGKKCSGSSKSFRNLPLIRKTGQGINLA